jgi:hypothetical protein
MVPTNVLRKVDGFGRRRPLTPNATGPTGERAWRQWACLLVGDNARRLCCDEGALTRLLARFGARPRMATARGQGTQRSTAQQGLGRHGGQDTAWGNCRAFGGLQEGRFIRVWVWV